MATVAAAGPEDATRAVDAAAAAFDAWAATTPTDRRRLFLRAADALEARASEVVGAHDRRDGCHRRPGAISTCSWPPKC